jgi:hypothetical protein
VTSQLISAARRWRLELPSLIVSVLRGYRRKLRAPSLPVSSGSESNSVIVRSCRIAPFYVAWGATTRDSDVIIPVESGTPPCQRTSAVWGRGATRSRLREKPAKPRDLRQLSSAAKRSPPRLVDSGDDRARVRLGARACRLRQRAAGRVDAARRAAAIESSRGHVAQPDIVDLGWRRLQRQRVRALVRRMLVVHTRLRHAARSRARWSRRHLRRRRVDAASAPETELAAQLTGHRSLRANVTVQGCHCRADRRVRRGGHDNE